MTEWIPEEEWQIIVANVPIVSVDLLVECPDGIVLGKRTNEPASGEWFVPGGRVRKGERLEDAVHRIGHDELGVDIEIQDKLGTFEHFYDTSDVGSEKHYVAHGFHVRTEDTVFESDTQHGEIAVFDEVPSGLHEHVEAYLDASELTELPAVSEMKRE